MMTIITYSIQILISSILRWDFNPFRKTIGAPDHIGPHALAQLLTVRFENLREASSACVQVTSPAEIGILGGIDGTPGGLAAGIEKARNP